jgi:hypothetical protein
MVRSFGVSDGPHILDATLVDHVSCKISDLVQESKLVDIGPYVAAGAVRLQAGPLDLSTHHPRPSDRTGPIAARGLPAMLARVSPTRNGLAAVSTRQSNSTTSR